MNAYYQDDYCTIYHGDCREILPSLPKVDLVLTDPPYGIGMDTSIHKSAGRIQHKKIKGDDKPFDAHPLCQQYQHCVLWGANNYHHTLPPGGGWLVWDKRSPDGSSDKLFGWPFELAWCSRDRFARIYRIPHGAYLNADRSGRRVHPTQKPVKLMAAILKDFDGSTVLDPFMGSGTTLRAAKDLRRKCIGIEIEEKYCEIAARRLAKGDDFENIKTGIEKCKGVQQGFGL